MPPATAAAKIVPPVLLLLLTACNSNTDFSFTQLRGFDDIRANLSSQPPTAAEQALLHRHQPLLFVAGDDAMPLDFYQDYIAHGELRAGGNIIRNPSSAVLNAHKHDPQAQFTHHPDSAPTAATAYGGVHRATLPLDGVGDCDLTFLSYHFVFRHSGLPTGISGWKMALANLVGNSRDWHQLDHYTAAYLVLHQQQLRAVLLQQHNNMRAYLVGGDDFPADAAVQIAAAASSNELYPHHNGGGRYRAVDFLSPSSVDYLLELDDGGGFNGAYDLVDAPQQVAYTLKFLPPNDAFYVFEGILGERRKLPGRDGPPGAMYRTLPPLWDLEKSLHAFFWNEGDDDYAELIRNGDAGMDGFSGAMLARTQQRLAAAWRQQFGDNSCQ